mmetsp:Transcript_5169/g.16659  ORF Transcript_5169/g.16659 Transcript_5169/m.16659 type:complete len:230 (-) Transcript_5169:287-976(-)
MHEGHEDGHRLAVAAVVQQRVEPGGALWTHHAHRGRAVVRSQPQQHVAQVRERGRRWEAASPLCHVRHRGRVGHGCGEASGGGGAEQTAGQPRRPPHHPQQCHRVAAVGTRRQRQVRQRQLLQLERILPLAHRLERPEHGADRDHQQRNHALQRQRALVSEAPLAALPHQRLHHRPRPRGVRLHPAPQVRLARTSRPATVTLTFTLTLTDAAHLHIFGRHHSRRQPTAA